MKKIILLITLLLTAFFNLLPAVEHENFAMATMYELRGETLVYESNRSKTLFKDINVTLTLLKSNDTSIDIDNIKTHEKKFHAIPKSETFQETNTTYWLKVNLGDTFPSGRFVYSYGDAAFSKHTFLPSQMLEKFIIDGHQNMKFTYTKESDPQSYYFKLTPKHFKIPFRFVYVSTAETFYAYLKEHNIIQLLLGLIIGLILMAGIYNAAMYYYNKDVSFLYYTLMQFFMVVILYIYSGAFLWDEGSYFSRNISFQSILSISASLFATLFSMYFLETKTHLPKFYKVYLLALIILGIDLIISIFYESLLIRYFILPFLMLGLIYAGYKRMRQGYKPARFYLAGWTVLTLAVFLNIFQLGYAYTIIDPLYIGSAIEAILFSLALSYKMHMVAQEKEAQKELLVHQSKLASMGEMIGNIAHQWRQPLSHLSYTFMNIKEAQKHGELDESYLTKKVDEATVQLEFMSQTIDDFKDFYLPTKEKEYFMLSHATKETLEMMEHTFKTSDIKIIFNIEKDFEIVNYKNEYKQVLLNLLSNAKDALIERVTISPTITITLAHHTLTVSDNAGGIQKEILDRIFEPYFSTKEGNSGIGLYMSKMIVEKNMGGKITLINTHEGICCSISF